MPKNQTKMMILAALFVAITAVCAQIRIALGPVPFTLQIFSISLMGMLLGKRWGAISALGYLLLGAFGAPVFSGFQGGLQAIVGKTGGYLLAFVPAAYVIGWILEQGRINVWKAFLANLLGLLIIYAGGVSQLKIVLNVPWETAFQWGVLPFVIPDSIKLVLASMLGVKITHHLANTGFRPIQKFEN